MPLHKKVTQKAGSVPGSLKLQTENTKGRVRRSEEPTRMEAAASWGQSVVGAAALLGCALVWRGASWLEAGT